MKYLPRSYSAALNPATVIESCVFCQTSQIAEWAFKPPHPQLHCSVMQCSTVQYSTVQWSAVQCSTVQYSTMECSAVQYSAVQYSAIPCITVQYSTGCNLCPLTVSSPWGCCVSKEESARPNPPYSLISILDHRLKNNITA